MNIFKLKILNLKFLILLGLIMFPTSSLAQGQSSLGITNINNNATSSTTNNTTTPPPPADTATDTSATEELSLEDVTAPYILFENTGEGGDLVEIIDQGDDNQIAFSVENLPASDANPVPTAEVYRIQIDSDKSCQVSSDDNLPKKNINKGCGFEKHVSQVNDSNNFTVNWDTSGSSSGIYLVRVAYSGTDGTSARSSKVVVVSATDTGIDPDEIITDDQSNEKYIIQANKLNGATPKVLLVYRGLSQSANGKQTTDQTNIKFENFKENIFDYSKLGENLIQNESETGGIKIISNIRNVAFADNPLSKITPVQLEALAVATNTTSLPPLSAEPTSILVAKSTTKSAKLAQKTSSSTDFGLSKFLLKENNNNVPNPNTLYNSLSLTIVKWLRDIAVAVGIISVVWSGVQLMTSFGDENRTTTAKRNLTWSILGFALVFFAIIIVQVVINIIKFNSFRL